ncbi:MAG: prephenate dehydrogenase/arogenate dehydrogenase family protein [Verrucomicrobiota bacterium]
MTFRRVAVFGPGLLGASVALSAKSRGVAEEVVLWGRRAERVEAAREKQLADRVTDSVEEATDGADLLVIATPAGSVPKLAEQICAASPTEGAVMTDVTSVKESVVHLVRDVLAKNGSPVFFIGSHPMAGSEKSGLEFADADLFEGRTCILTPASEEESSLIDRLEVFWTGLGCKILTMSPSEHDQTVARVSHLPHAVAAAIVHAALGPDVAVARAAGAGFRDTTRVAGGPAEMWAEILLENRDAVRESLSETINSLSELLAILDGMEKERLRAFLDSARDLREKALKHD